VRRSERRRERARGARRGNGAGDARRRRIVRVALVVGGAVPTGVGLLAAVTGLPVLSTSLVAAALALSFAACWLGAVGAAHVVARVLARR